MSCGSSSRLVLRRIRPIPLRRADQQVAAHGGDKGQPLALFLRLMEDHMPDKAARRIVQDEIVRRGGEDAHERRFDELTDPVGGEPGAVQHGAGEVSFRIGFQHKTPV